jgi:hypothetical protein
MNEDLKELLNDFIILINILAESCTQVYGDGVIEHEHKLFDNTDMDNLKKLKIKIANKLET